MDYTNPNDMIEFCGDNGMWHTAVNIESFTIVDGYNSDDVNHGDYVLKLNLPWGNYFRILTKEEFDLWVVASKGEI
jgi:hypothetical protein